MSNYAYQCCCGTPSCTGCPSSSCPCNSSYAVTGINFTYQFIYGSPAIPCAECNTGCYRKEYSILLTFTQPTAISVTRRTCPETNACGWYGQFELTCNYTVELEEEGKCFGASSSGLNRIKKSTWTGSRTVQACLHITCGGCANHEGCTGNLTTNTKAWFHRLEICDFAIACSNVTILGGKASANAPCEAGADCDWGAPPGYLPCDYGPLSLRCIGGSLGYVSKYLCLSTLQAQDWRCQGWYQTRLCELPCTGTISQNPTVSTLSANVNANGVFAMYLDDECSAGDPGDDGDCDKTNRVAWGSAMQTLLGDSTLLTALTSYCGSVDDVIPVPSCPQYQYTVFQSGCPNPWTYT